MNFRRCRAGVGHLVNSRSRVLSGHGPGTSQRAPATAWRHQHHPETHPGCTRPGPQATALPRGHAVGQKALGPLDAGPDSPDPSSNLFRQLPCLREMGGGRGWPDRCACRLCLVLEGLLSPISLDSAGSSGSSLLPRPHTRPPPSHTVCKITRARSAGPHGNTVPFHTCTPHPRCRCSLLYSRSFPPFCLETCHSASSPTQAWLGCQT